MANSIERIIYGLEEISAVAKALRQHEGEEPLGARLDAAGKIILDSLIQLTSSNVCCRPDGIADAAGSHG